MPPDETMLTRMARAMRASKAWSSFWSQDDAEELARAALEPWLNIPDSIAVPGGIAIEEAMFNDGKLVFDGARDCVSAAVRAALAEHKEGRQHLGGVEITAELQQAMAAGAMLPQPPEHKKGGE